MAGRDEAAAGSSASVAQIAIEALSAGRAKRSTAGNRMRELLEQERDRMGAEDDSSQQRERNIAVKAARNDAKGRGDDAEEDNSMFLDDDNDIDFEEVQGPEGAEDIVDSDFDQSSDDAANEDDEEEGERRLIEEEKAAKKASRAKAKAVPSVMRPRPAPLAPANGAEGTASQPQQQPSADEGSRLSRSARRIGFAVSTSGQRGGSSAAADAAAAAAAKRASKRKATMRVTQDVQERVQQEEERRAKLREVAQPKPKKVRLSQADYIAEALEIEDRNRESLKVYFEREEERRERDRRRGKRKMEGPYLRWRSFAVDRNAVNRQIIQVLPDDVQGKDDQKAVAPLTEDPVLAARRAAAEERERAAAKEAPKGGDGQPVLPNNSRGGNEGAQPGVLNEPACSELPGANQLAKEQPSHQKPEPEAATEVPKSREASTRDTSHLETKSRPEEIDNAQNASELLSADRSETRAAPPEEDSTISPARLSSSDVATTSKTALKSEGAVKNLQIGDAKADTFTSQTPDWEARAIVSLHNLAVSTPWPAFFSHVLGSHVDWSKYAVVPARNRPLRPRQSVCPVTGLPARYRDPRTGIAFATREAYTILTQLMRGEFRWATGGARASTAGSSDKIAAVKRSNPLELGCYMDRLDEPGACNVLLMASLSMPPKAFGGAGKGDPQAPSTQGNTAGDGGSAVPAAAAIYGPRSAIAPGDEQAVMAAASALPAGSTRSGGRRSGAR